MAFFYHQQIYEVAYCFFFFVFYRCSCCLALYYKCFIPFVALFYVTHELLNNMSCDRHVIPNSFPGSNLHSVTTATQILFWIWRFFENRKSEESFPTNPFLDSTKGTHPYSRRGEEETKIGKGVKEKAKSSS